MENNFFSVRLESTRINKYLLKKLKNKSSRAFVSIYNTSSKEITDELKKATVLYSRAHSGILNICITDCDIEKISNEDIMEVYKRIKQKSSDNFRYFYESYLRKINKSYSGEYIQNALADLKDAYYIYRKLNNSLWNLEDSQVTEQEMTNLYHLLLPNQENPNISQKTIDEK